MRVVFVDCETGHLDPQLGNILSYTIQAWADGLTGPAQTVYLLPTLPVDPGAAKVNGYTPEEWARRGATRHFDWNDRQILTALDGAIVGGHNVKFDLGFIEAECRRLQVAVPSWNHRNIDTQALSMPLVAMGVIKSASLKDVAAFLGLPSHDAHTSEGDVRNTIAVWEWHLGIYLDYKERAQGPVRAS